MDPGVGLDDMEKRMFLTLPGLELGHLGRPSCIPTTLSRLLNNYGYSLKFHIFLHSVNYCLFNLTGFNTKNDIMYPKLTSVPK
jgi:hypothetical protein